MNFRLARTALAAIAIGIFASLAGAQDRTTTEAKPSAPPQFGAYGNGDGHMGLTCGAGASTSHVAVKPTVQCGALMTLMPLPIDLEVGMMGPQANRSALSGYLSTNAWIPLLPAKGWGNKHGVPLIVGGYTRMFETGHALDYGVAFARPVDASRSIQFEVRDYWAFANPNQHNVVFRVVWLIGITD